VRTIAVTQRVTVIAEYGERRDCLDQAWARFLAACELLPLPLPNVAEVALELCREHRIEGLLLTGGNDLASLGGDAPERDHTERSLLDLALTRRLPVLGVCRGMQMIQQQYAVPLTRVAGHVARRQSIEVEGRPTVVNSYHHFGAYETRAPLETWAIASDGVIKAVRHASEPVTGIMWHPERCVTPAAEDVGLFRRIFGGAGCAR